MLPIKGILTLDHAHMMTQSEISGCLVQRHLDLEIGYRRPLDRCILLRGALHTDRTTRDHDIAGLHIEVHTACRTDTDEGIRPAHMQLLDRNRRRRPADTGGGHGNRNAVQRTRIGHILPMIRYKHRIIEILRDLLAALRVARQDHVPSDLPRCHTDVIHRLIF